MIVARASSFVMLLWGLTVVLNPDCIEYFCSMRILPQGVEICRQEDNILE